MMLLFKANVVTDFLQIGIGEFLVKCKRFQTMKVAFLLPVFYKGLCLVEVDVRMVAQPLYATTVQVDEVDGPGVDGKPGLQLIIVCRLLRIPFSAPPSAFEETISHTGIIKELSIMPMMKRTW